MAESLALQESKASNLQYSTENEIVDVADVTSTIEPTNSPVELQRPDQAQENVVKNMSPGAQKLRSWLNQSLRIEMSDGRVLTGDFLCTDRDRNVILGSCCEYLPPTPDNDGKIQELTEERRVLGLVMVPGKHIVTIHLDDGEHSSTDDEESVSVFFF